MNAFAVALIVTGALVVAGAATVALLPSERTATRTMTFDAPPAQVHAIYADAGSQTRWRSDVDRIEWLSDGSDGAPRSWIEHPKRGPAIRFTERENIAGERLVLDMESDGAFRGTYTAEFASAAIGGTEARFTESIELLGPIAKVFSNLFVDLDQTIERYGEDARTEIERRRVGGN